MQAGTRVINVWRQSFKRGLPGKLCQSEDLFGSALIFTFHKYFEVPSKFWHYLIPRIHVYLCFFHKNLKKSSFFTVFFHFYEFLVWPFRELGRFVNKIKLRTGGRAPLPKPPNAYERRSVIGRAPASVTQYCYLLTSLIRNSWRKRSRKEIVKKMSKVPKRPIIWLLLLSGRGYQVISRFCPGVPDRKVA